MNSSINVDAAACVIVRDVFFAIGVVTGVRDDVYDDVFRVLTIARTRVRVRVICVSAACMQRGYRVREGLGVTPSSKMENGW